MPWESPTCESQPLPPEAHSLARTEVFIMTQEAKRRVEKMFHIPSDEGDTNSNKFLGLANTAKYVR